MEKYRAGKTRHISDVVIHPNNPDVVYVAAQGPVHGPSPDRGIYKSTDGGATWKKTLSVDDNTGASSLSMDMTNPRVLYAATWQHRRYPWKVESGGPGSNVWKSTDAGETWNKINEGLPKEMGKIGVSVSVPTPTASSPSLKQRNQRQVSIAPMTVESNGRS